MNGYFHCDMPRIIYFSRIDGLSYKKNWIIFTDSTYHNCHFAMSVHFSFAYNFICNIAVINFKLFVFRRRCDVILCCKLRCVGWQVITGNNGVIKVDTASDVRTTTLSVQYDIESMQSLDESDYSLRDMIEIEVVHSHLVWMNRVLSLIIHLNLVLFLL